MTHAQAIASIAAALQDAARSGKTKVAELSGTRCDSLDGDVALVTVNERGGIRVLVQLRPDGAPADARCSFCRGTFCRHALAALAVLKEQLEASAIREAGLLRARTANSFRELVDLARESRAAQLLSAHVSELVQNAPGVPPALRTTPIGKLSSSEYRALAPDVQRLLASEVRRRLEKHVATATPAGPLDELLAWAEKHQVSHLLDEALPGLSYGEPLRKRLEAMAALPDNPYRRHFFQQVKSQLGQHAKVREAAAAELALAEYSRPPRPDGVLGELFDRLGVARGELLAHRTEPQQAYAASVDVDFDALDLRVSFSARSGYAREAHVAIGLEAWREKLNVRCSRCRKVPCAHCALAVEQARLTLGRFPFDTQERFERLLTQPGWQRVLDRMPASSAEPRSRDVAVFVLETSGDWVTDFVLHARGPKSKSPLGRKLSAHAFRRELPLSREDEKAYEWWELSRRLERSYGGASSDEADDLFYRALEALLGHPRVVDRAGNPVEVRRVQPTLRVTGVDAGFTLAIEAGDTGLQGDALKRANALFASGPPRCAALVGGKCLLIDRPPELGLWASMVERFGGIFPPEAGPALAERLEALEGRVTVEKPASLAGQQREADARPVVTLRLRDDGGLELSVGVRPLDEGATFVAGEGPARVYVTAGDTRYFAVRDFEAEARARGELFAKLGLPERDELGVPAERAVDVVAALEGLGGAAHIEWAGRSLVRTRPAQTKDVRLVLRKRRDWFGVDGRVSVDGVDVVLDELLAAVRAGRRHLRVGPDRSLTLSEELRARLMTLSALAHRSGEANELASGALPVFEQLTEGFGAVEAPDEWKALAKKLVEARAERFAVPEGLQASLRDYQLKGFEWLSSLGAWGAGACLADDMGLGKTLQALAVLLHRAKLGPALVIAPTSVCGNWLSEAKRFAPELDVKLHHGGGRDRALEQLRAGQVLVTSYGVLARDVDTLCERDFATLVLDEAHALKNAATARAQAARRLKASFRVALTGTPLENRLGELWSLFRVVQPGLLGSEEWFRERFVRPIEGAGDADARASLAQIIRPFVLRRLKREVATELPARTETTVRVEPPPRERARYEEERRLATAKLGTVDLSDAASARLHVLAALTRLRQLACHVKLVDADWSHGSAKLEHLLELADALRAEGHKVLVFSQFVKLLELVRPALEERGARVLQLDGSTAQAEREKRVRRFQEGGADVFLLSLKAGGVGLNLTAATYVVHLDPWWNPAVEDQATDRAHRIGQTQPVTVYRLVTAGTVEEQMLSLHAEKRALVEGVLDGTGAAGALSTEELLELVRGEALGMKSRSSTARTGNETAAGP